MSVSDPIADMLAMIKNANRAGHAKIELGASKVHDEPIRFRRMLDG